MHNSKICFKCNIDKPLSEFYKHEQMADGHLNKCKECTKKDTRLNIEKNKDYYIEYDRSRANIPKRVAARLAYSKTEAGRAAARKSREKWSEHNVIKRSASYIVNNAIKHGRLIKPNVCEACGKGSQIIHGHHDNYDYPMIVRWLCPSCHSKWHKENGSGLNG